MTSLETQKMEIRTSLKALDFKRSRVACRMANSLGIVGTFFIDHLPLDDPRLLESDVAELENLQAKIYNLTWKLDALEHDAARHHARQACFDFINLLSLEESKEFLQKAGCLNTTELIEKLIINPSLIEEVVLNE